MTLSYEETRVPIEELVELFEFVENNMDYRLLKWRVKNKFEVLISHFGHTSDQPRHYRVNKNAWDKINAMVLKYYAKE